MPEFMIVHEPGDRFATMSDVGVVRIWRVTVGGLVEQVEGPFDQEAPDVLVVPQD